jgi:hypothetical protein
MNKRQFRRQVNGMLRRRFLDMPRLVVAGKWRAARQADGTVRVVDNQGRPMLAMPRETFERAMLAAGYVERGRDNG